MVIWLVVEPMRGGQPPRILGAFRDKKKAERVAYDPVFGGFRNIIKLRVL